MKKTHRIGFKILFTLLVFWVMDSAVSAAPGDGHWDRQFGMPGTTTRNYALRVHGGRIYTAGVSISSSLVATNTHINVFDGTNWTGIGEITGS